MVILAAVDRSNKAADVIKEAESLAIAFDDSVHVVHVLSTSEFVRLGQTSAEKGDSIDMDEIREAAADVAADAAGDLDVPFETIGLMGDAAHRIVDYADERDTRYITIAGRKRSPAGKALFGSVSQSVLLNANCPVVSTISRKGE